MLLVLIGSLSNLQRRLAWSRPYRAQ